MRDRRAKLDAAEEEERFKEAARGLVSLFRFFLVPDQYTI